MTADTTSSAEMLAALYRHSPTAVIVTDNQRQLTGMNPAAERLFGYTESEVHGRESQIFYSDPRDFDRLGKTLFNPAIAADTRSYDTRYRAKSGRIFDSETIATPIIAKNGERTGFVCIIRDVTAELALHARLEASDIQLRVALSSANEGAFSLNLVSGLGSTRGFINEFLGITAADATISLSRWTEALSDRDRRRFEHALSRLQRQPDSTLDFIYQAKRADGVWRWLHTRGRVSEFDRSGQPLRVSGIVADVTDRKQLEIRLADRERQLANAISAGSCGIWEVDTAHEGVSVIGPIRAMLGLPETPERVEFSRYQAGIHPEDLPRVTASTGALIEGKTDTIDIEYRLKDARDDTWVWLRSRGDAHRGENGKRVMAGVLTDITDQKRLEDRLATSEQLLREALESVDDGAWSIDLERQTIRVSGFLKRLSKVTSSNDEIPIRTWLELRPFEDRDLGLERLEALANPPEVVPAAEEMVVFDFRILDRNGECVWVRSRGRVIARDENGKPLRAAGTASDVTEEKRLQAELQDRELRFHEALQATNEGAWRINLKTRISDVTAVISEMIGLPPRNARVARDELLARIHPADRPIAEEAFAKLSSGKADTIDYTVRLHSQKAGWIHIHSRGRVSAYDQQGNPLVANGFLSDVTERLETSKRLQEREDQLSDAITATALGLFRIDIRKGELWLRGNVANELFGTVDESRVSTRDWQERVHPDDLARVEHETKQLILGAISVSEVEYRMRRQDGVWAWYHVTGRVIDRGTAGRATNITGVVWNIDATKRLNETIVEERRRFEAIYRATPAMLHTINADGVIVEVSEYWLSHLGYERSEVIGRRSIDFLDPESQKRAVEQSLPALFKTGRNTDVPYRFIRKDGTMRDMLLSSFLDRDGHGGPMLSYAVMTDITDLREAYTQLERSNEELDRFATVASHDLQEPLRKVAAFAGIIRRRYLEKLDEDGVRSLDYLVDAAQRMQQLIDDLLSYSRMASQPLNLQPLDLGALFSDVLEQLDETITGSQAELCIGELPTVQADPLLLRQVVQNLVSNALKYCGNDIPRIDVSSEITEQGAVIRIRDNGIGIEEKFFDKIFAPFQRLHTREQYAGTGIGLAIVSQAIERHGGRVWVTSTPGGGSTFSFSIPTSPASRAESGARTG